jgi:hypothetical protein
MNFQVSINDSTIEFTFTNEEGTFHAIYDKSDKTFEKLYYSTIELFFKNYEEKEIMEKLQYEVKDNESLLLKVPFYVPPKTLSIELLLKNESKVNVNLEKIMENKIKELQKQNDEEIKEIQKKKDKEIKELPNKEFLKCCQEGNLIFAKYLFEKYSIDLEYYDKENKATCLCWAAYNGHYKASLSMVKFLIENGANIEGKSSTDTTPIMFASIKGHITIVKYLHENGANIHKINFSNDNAFSIAAWKGHLEIVKYLYEKNVNFHLIDSNGKNAMENASNKGHTHVIEFLKTIM